MAQSRPLSKNMLKLYEQAKRDLDLERASTKEIERYFGISNTSAKRLRRHHQAVAPRKSVIKQPLKPITHLVIGDAHAAPNQSLERFTLLGRMVRDIKPDVVVCIGDWADMESLSSYDKGKRSFEGRRYSKDVEAANEALRLFHKEIDDYNRDFPNNKVNPRFVYCEGNHEWRIARACNDSPGLDTISLDDLDFKKRGWEVFPFLLPAEIDQVNYCHYFTSQNTDRAISGVNAARNLLVKKHVTCVVGHSHLLQHYSTIAGNSRIHGLVCGWYCDIPADYARQSNPGWWNGICILRNVKDGDFDLETWSYERIKNTWG